MQVFIGIILLALSIQTLRLREAERRARELGFDKLALVAQRDRSRTVNAKDLAAIRKIYGDSIRAAERLIVQTKQQNSTLGNALGQETKLAADLVLMVKDLNTQLTGTPVTVIAGDVRVDSFTVDSIKPYHVKAVALLPPAPKAGTLNLWIRQDTTRLNIHAGCLPKNADGLRPASLTVVSDSVDFAMIGAVTQDREVCNPAPRSGVALPWWVTPSTGLLGVLLGLLLHRP